MTTAAISSNNPGFFDCIAQQTFYRNTLPIDKPCVFPVVQQVLGVFSSVIAVIKTIYDIAKVCFSIYARKGVKLTEGEIRTINTAARSKDKEQRENAIAELDKIVSLKKYYTTRKTEIAEGSDVINQYLNITEVDQLLIIANANQVLLEAKHEFATDIAIFASGILRFIPVVGTVYSLRMLNKSI